MSFTFINLTYHTIFLMSARRRANDFVFDMNCYEEIFKMCWNIGTLEHWNNYKKKSLASLRSPSFVFRLSYEV